MTDTPIKDAINRWRYHWIYNRQKHDSGPTDDKAWEEYLKSLTISEFVWNLEIYDERV